MNSRRYLGQAAMEAAVLPSRAAYLIAVGSKTGFRVAVMQASSRWGGMTEPVVEASTSGLSKQHEQAVRTASVEALVNVDADPAAAEQIASSLGLPVVALADMRQYAVVFTCSPDGSGSSLIGRMRLSQRAPTGRCGNLLWPAAWSRAIASTPE